MEYGERSMESGVRRMESEWSEELSAESRECRMESGVRSV